MTKPHNKRKPLDPQIVELVDQHQRDLGALVEILRELDTRQQGLEREAIADVAHLLHIPDHSAYGVASFYSMLSMNKRSSGILRVCDGPVCWLCGADETRRHVEAALQAHPGWTVERTSCLGLCDRAPAVLVNDEQAGPISADQAAGLAAGYRGAATDYAQPRPGELRVMLAKTGLVDPDSLDSALAQGAYQGLQAALGHTPGEVISIVEASGLAGRGGAGFPVGRKWRFVHQAERKPKYVICNADESEPLIFKDRVLIDTNPHQVLEGMAIAGYATGASEAFIYIRGEYQQQAARLERAIHQAEQAGYLGEKVMGSGFSYKIHVHLGAGAYICGEETALIESLEGKRGEPRLRPPYPPTAGYQGLPTLVNNVETYAAVPAIISNGAEWYRYLSAAQTPGTKLYMILGHINHPGLFEAPFGLTLRQVIEEFGGGMRPGSEFHFALTGGAAGTIVPGSLMDIPIDYASGSKGVSLGAGAFLICDQSVSPVALLSQLLHFFAAESCGKCTPCRVGTHRSHAILSRLVAGQGQPGDVAELHELAEYMQEASFCGLGQSVATPMKTALNSFPDEFQAAEIGKAS
ncbi:MAG: NAD(P)H-dependent oxidoreductase subunit E [Anaerolineales bacterium]|nr:NAD(P)H-dependent oxidoreductase subunit E [Anaerolineales bacterium]